MQLCLQRQSFGSKEQLTADPHQSKTGSNYELKSGENKTSTWRKTGVQEDTEQWNLNL